MNQDTISSSPQAQGRITMDSLDSSRVDSKSKILILLFFTFILLLCITYEQILLAFSWLIILGITYKTKWNAVLKKFIMLLPVLLALSLLALISPQSTRTLHLMNFTVTYNTFEYTSFMFLRSSILILQALFLIESEHSFTQIIYALDSLGFPLFLINSLFFMYRMTIDLDLTARQLLEARYLRSSNRKWGRSIFTFQVLGFMIGNLFVRAMLLREQRKTALELRQFNGQFPHTPIQFTLQGVFLLWLTCLISILLLFLTGLHYLPLGTLNT